MARLRWPMLLSGALLALAFLVFRGMGWFTRPPANLGVSEGRLAACPDRPNCVSSQDESSEHGILPLSFSEAPEQAWQRLRTVLDGMPQATLVTEQPEYLHYEFRTPLMGYVDDVEFLRDDRQNVIHFRSASRLGYSDLGTNRRRMEQIRTQFQRSGTPSVSF